MQITKIIETEVILGTSAGAATSISSATCVRLCNYENQPHTVGINTMVGAATTTYLTLVENSIEYLQKSPTDVIWSTTGTVKANKVAFTN